MSERHENEYLNIARDLLKESFLIIAKSSKVELNTEQLRNIEHIADAIVAATIWFEVDRKRKTHTGELDNGIYFYHLLE